MQKKATTPTQTPHEPRVLSFDIEATSLNATFGIVLCVGYKWLGEPKVYCPTILDYSPRDMLDDKELVKRFVEGPYSEADYTVGWYSARYDIPMLKARAIKHGLKPFPPIYHIDLWHQWRRQFKTHNNRLGTVGEFLKLPHDKTPIDFEAWQRAAIGHRPSMKKVVTHCKADVLVLEEAFTRIRPWLDNEPGRGLMTGEKMACPSCGSKRMHARAYKLTQAGVYRQYQCHDCGKYARGRTAVDRTELRSTI